MSKRDWPVLVQQVQSDPILKATIDIVLMEAARQVRAAQPASASRLTFWGGLKRGAAVITKMRQELR